MSHRILRGDGPIILSSAITDFKASLVRQPSTWTPTRDKKRLGGEKRNGSRRVKESIGGEMLSFPRPENRPGQTKEKREPLTTKE